MKLLGQVLVIQRWPTQDLGCPFPPSLSDSPKEAAQDTTHHVTASDTSLEQNLILTVQLDRRSSRNVVLNDVFLS